MAVGKEIRGKIKSVESTMKITKAMQMVAASKMRRAQDRMRAARPYCEKVREIAAHLSQTTPDYRHPFMVANEQAKVAGFVMVTTDKGLCGGLNVNLQRAFMNKLTELRDQGISSEVVAFGGKGLGFLNRISVKVVSNAVGLGDPPHMESLIGPMKVLLDDFINGRINAIYLCYTRFVNTMKQEPVIEQLLPLGAEHMQVREGSASWEYIYEPDAKSVIDDLLLRYVESLVYQTVVENLASEHSARMVAMQAATDNAGNIVEELKLVYNKTRQAAITTELTEIVAGAAAV